MSLTGSIIDTQNRHHASETPLLDCLRRDGFVVVSSLLKPAQLSSLRAASGQVVELSRNGKWPHIRTVPKQFPPWPRETPSLEDGSIWGVQHLLHPSIPGRKIFAELYFSNEVIEIVKELVGLQGAVDADEELVMELFNLLVSPTGERNFELTWHRDDVRSDIDSDEEECQLREKTPNGQQLHSQYNIALYQDESLIVIPGSHRRIRTLTERRADPCAAHLPGQVIVHLKPGDAVFYNSNILHRGVYKGINHETEIGRMTLHGSVGLAGFGKERARQVLQHGVGDWAREARFDVAGETGVRAERMRQRLVEMGGGCEAGYSQID
jgi:Phytanoyl-CoA dioxygenase (PhyH)